MLDGNLSAVFGQFWAWKTYMMVQQAFSAYKKGAIVISNCWLSFPHIRIYTPDDLLPILTDISTIHERYITPALAPDSYYTREILGYSAIRHPSAITNIPDYIKKYPCPFLSIDSEAIKDATRPKPEGVDSAKQIITPERHERWASDMGVGTPQKKLPLWNSKIVPNPLPILEEDEYSEIPPTPPNYWGKNLK